MKRNTSNTNACARSCDPTSRDRTLTLALLLAPALLAAGWGVLLPEPGPTNAYASATITDPALAQTPKRIRKATEEETAATAYCMGLCERTGDITAPTMIPGVIDALVDDTEETGSGDPDRPVIQIASLLRDAQGRPAVYADGALFVEGDDLINGWIIQTIDMPRRSVTIAHPDADEPIVLMPGR